MKTISKVTNRYYALDIARFVAAFAVMVYHYTATSLYNVGSSRPILSAPKESFPELFSFTKFGFLGVHLFFMISGFVILASALNRRPIDFAISRFLRLYPTYWVCVAFTTVCLYFFLAEHFDTTLFAFVANLTMVQKLLSVPNIDPVYWTLFYELQFYACIFVLMITGTLKYIRTWIAGWLVVTLCYLVFEQPFFLPKIISPEYSAYFIAGVCFYMAANKGFDRFNVSCLVISLIVMIYELYRFMPQDDRIFTVYDLAIEVLITLSFYVFFILVALNKLSLTKSSIIVFIGGLTYPLYLIHFAVGRYAFNAMLPYMAAWQVVIVLMLVALAIASIIYYLCDVLLVPNIKKRMYFLNNK